MPEHTSLPRPTPAQQRWQDHEIGVVYHFELTTYNTASRSGHVRDLPPADQRLYQPDRLDMDQWLAAAKAIGAGYAIFTVTHESGFMQWPSEIYPYGVSHIPWRHGRADPVREFVDACRRVDIAPAFFIGMRFNAWCNVHTYHVRDGDEAAQAWYRDICCRQMAELMSRYGPLEEIWMEGGLLDPEHGGPDLLPIAERYQPDTVFYHCSARGDHRWVGNEEGIAGDPCWATMPHRGGREAHDDPAYHDLLANGDPDAPYWSPAMCDVPLRNHNWFWWPDEDHLVHPLEALMDMYRKSVGRNGVLTLGLTPDRRGLLPDADMQRCEEFGRELRRRYTKPLASTSGKGSSLVLELPEPARIREIAVMEDIRHGERIRHWQLFGQADGDSWQALAEGACIGHKRLVPVNAPEIAAVRLACPDPVGTPQIRHFAAYQA